MKWRILAVLGLAELLGMVVWFSASAVTPALVREWGLGEGDQAWLTMAVQLGFVLGTLLSALLNLSDLFSARHLFSVSALAGGVINGVFALWVESLEPALILRFLTGLFLAGVYPPAMKILASWFKEGRGLAIGVLVGALTVGSASPHLLKALGSPDWRMLMLTAAVASLIASLLCATLVKDGPLLIQRARFDWRYIGRALTNRGVRLANFGYLGHIWELYAVWTWLPVFLMASFAESGVTEAGTWSAVTAFGAIALGGVGCAVAGLLGDRYGRTTVTTVALLVSAGCCALVGLTYGGNPVAVVLVCMIWGVAVIADSAQFSAAVTELADQAYVGTAITLQICLGFTLSVVTIRLIPVCVEWLTWEWTFSPLAIGPLLGVWAMLRLRVSPEAARIGGELRGRSS